jgi:hypothetical protein
MSARYLAARWRAPARPPVADPLLRTLVVAVLVPLAGTLLVHAATATDPAPTTRWLDGAAAQRAGVALQLVRHDSAPATFEVRGAGGAPFAGTLLDVAADGASAAVADATGRGASALAVAAADGSQLQVGMEGILAATFSADGSRLAVVDGHGRLWSLDVVTRTVGLVSDGPFVDAPLIEANGTILALAVSSVEAPYASRLVAVAPDGTAEARSGEPLVYDATRLADGSLAVIAHRPGGTVVLRQADGRARELVDLGADAVHVTISADGRVLAWENAGRIHARSDGRSVVLGDGSEPRVAPDGTALLVKREGHAVLLDLSGAALATLGPAAGFLPCATGCQP